LNNFIVDDCLATLPDAGSPDFYRQLVEFGRFVENECRPGCRYDFARWPNLLWQKVEARMLAGLQRFLAAEDESVTMLQWYNSGVFIRAAGKVIAFDIVPIPRYYGWPEPEGLTARIAAAIDVLLITHAHQDHFDIQLVNACRLLKKPVYMHPAALPADSAVQPAADGCRHDFDKISFVAHHACHVWRKSREEVATAAFEVDFAGRFRMLFCGDADYTRNLDNVRTQADAMFITWRNPGPQYEDGHPEQIGSTLDAVRLAVSRFAPRQLILEHYGELDHVYRGFSASYEMAIDLIRHIELPVLINFWGDMANLRSRDGQHE
jgi:L-ascorbate metabolism protein UlaG (beta-lactamase superfamily)